MSSGEQGSRLPGGAEAPIDAARPDPATADGRGPTRRGRVRTVDFTRPAKFTAEQERRLGRVLDTFCRTASTRLAAELRMPVELELIGTAQHTWANAHAQIPEGAICATVLTVPARTRLLLAADLQLVQAAIERLLGGTSDAGSEGRKLTEIDWVVARLFFQHLLTQLSAVFTDAAATELELESVESPLDCLQLTGVSEPTLAAVIELRHEDVSSTLTLLLPYTAFAPIAEAFASAIAGDGGDDTDPAAVAAAVGGVDVVVHAEVASLELPVEAILGIRPGDTVRLGGAASAGVALSVGGVEICRGAPGRVGPRRAVQVLP
jgi:flagellar motor switch protein FliM